MRSCISQGGTYTEAGNCENPTRTLQSVCRALGLSYSSSSNRCRTDNSSTCSDGSLVRGFDSSGELVDICIQNSGASQVQSAPVVSGSTTLECSSCGGANCSPASCPPGTTQVALTCQNGSVCGMYDGQQIYTRSCFRSCE